MQIKICFGWCTEKVLVGKGEWIEVGSRGVRSASGEGMFFGGGWRKGHILAGEYVGRVDCRWGGTSWWGAHLVGEHVGGGWSGGSGHMLVRDYFGALGNMCGGRWSVGRGHMLVREYYAGWKS